MLPQHQGPIEVAQEVDPLDLAVGHIEVSAEYTVDQPLLYEGVMIFLDQLHDLLGGPDVPPAVLKALDGCNYGGLLLRP